MANDVNDPLFDNEPRSMAAKLLPPLVLICAFGGFIALAIYAYKAGSQSVNEGELMVIEADKTPTKEKPEDPGGMQFPNQDKTIFDTFSAGSQPPPQVERVLPTPEEPMPKEVGANWANDKLDTATPAAPVSAEQVFGEDDAPPAPAPAEEKKEEPKNVAQTGPQVVNVREELGKQAVAEPAPAEPAKVVELAPKTLETMAEKAMQPVEKTAEKTAEKPVEKPKAASGGKQLVQLGAYRSEADAKADFAKIQKKNAALSGKSPVINRADLGEKGVFFRLRVGTDDAKALCAKLSASGQACMAVK
ncbi:MAG: SPOR domain-containing protein [Alphaproteobacteria bacterium]|nr:SPOR domain-containing protein [Alphaproteobacteria bacterium]